MSRPPPDNPVAKKIFGTFWSDPALAPWPFGSWLVPS
jgi:hypothetical protein